MPAVRVADLHRFTIDEFLAIERGSDERIALRDGYIYSMAGSTPEHEQILANIFGALHAALKGTPCQVYGSNLKIRGALDGFVLLPDLSVVCGGFSRDPMRRDVVTNPRVIVEVISPSTADDDRRSKFDAYGEIETLADYVLVSQDERRIEVHHRSEDGEWTLAVAVDEMGTAWLPSLCYGLKVDEAYDQVAPSEGA